MTLVIGGEFSMSSLSKVVPVSSCSGWGEFSLPTV
jgi:hypothetical protein